MDIGSNRMNVYWKDIEEFTDDWPGFAVNVESDTELKPNIHLQTGGDHRIKLVNGDSTVFWATILDDYGGVWVSKSFDGVEKSNMPIRPITSLDIESRRDLTGAEWLKSWTRFYLDELTSNSASFLYEGRWLFTVCKPIERKVEWIYTQTYKSQKHEETHVYEVKDCIKDEKLEYVDWWVSGSGKLINTRHPDGESGRVKWWRKKVKEERLPPILAWYLNCLDAYIIIDGHDRLLASIIEDKPPEIIVAYSAHEIEFPHDESVRHKIVHSIEQRQLDKRKKPMSIESINQTLINAFDDRPFNCSKTFSWASIASEDEWVSEVKNNLEGIEQSELIEDVILRKG